MKFSDQFGIPNPNDHEWFDPVLLFDTPLFVDPFLIYDDERDEFLGSHKQIIEFFEAAFIEVAKSAGNTGALSWKRAINLLLFPEIEEACLGYTGEGTRGGGSGEGVATLIAHGLREAISAGIVNLRHFEEVQLFNKGLGPDRISDATIGMLRDNFYRYTQRVATNLGIPLTEVRYQRAIFDKLQGRWTGKTYFLPINTYNKKPIILVPKRYLRTIPSINSDDYWSYCFDNRIEDIRNMFGDDIGRQVNKELIIEFAKSHPDSRQDYVDEKEQEGREPYDFFNDPAGVYNWYGDTKNWVDEHPVTLSFITESEFESFIDSIISEFRNYVENNRGWSLLWNDNETPKREEAVQFLFLGIVKHYCKANNIDISREVNIGRGPVDFKVAQGHKYRCLIELKLAKNTKFWNGLAEQLPKYMEAEEINLGRFVAILYTDHDIKRTQKIGDAVNSVNARTSYNINAVTIDARRDPPSASKL